MGLHSCGMYCMSCCDKVFVKLTQLAQILVLIAQFYTAVKPLSVYDFFLSYLALFVVIGFYIAGLIWKRQTWLRTADIDVDTGRREIDWEAYEQLKMEKQNWPAWKRVYHFLF